MSEDLETRLLIDKYGSRKELDEYTRTVAKGLRSDENMMLSRFVRRGRVLDVGCGAGREAIALAKRGIEVVGVDIVPAMVLRAKENSKFHGVQGNTRFEVHDARNMDFENESFDSVLMISNVIEHIRGRKNRVRILAEIKRILKSNGILIFTTHTRASRLRYRLYWSIVNGLRTMRRELTGDYYGPELGDRHIKRVSNVRSKGKVFVHIYTYDEALEDVADAGLVLADSKCPFELERGVDNIEVRKRAYEVFYVVKKS